MTDFSALPPTERVKYYRALVDQARSEVEAADSRLREQYILLAQNWERLALAAEAEAQKQPISRAGMN